MQCPNCHLELAADDFHHFICPHSGERIITRRQFLIQAGRLGAVAVTGSVLFSACGGPTIPTVPEFLAVSKLLADRQEIGLGVPQYPDSQGPGLTHFQLFKEQDNSVLNSAEMHSDGCIYIAYTPLKGPRWYDSYSANESLDHKDDEYSARPPRLPYGAKFSQLKQDNVSSANWKTPSEAFRGGRCPAPRWFKFCVPHGVSPDMWTERVKNQIPIKTRGDLLLDTGAYCYWDCGACSLSAKINGPPNWQTILPVNTDHENGQKKYFPDLPVQVTGPGGITNFYLTWSNVVGLAQYDPNRLIDILKWRGLPNEPQLDDGPIPWVSATVEGVVPNSFLSGEDPRPDHSTPPGHPGSFGDANSFWETDYWLGSPVPIEWSGSHGPGSTEDDPTNPNGFTVVNSLADDWIIYVRPEPEYRFMLASSPNAAAKANDDVNRNSDKFGKGNYDPEHMGSDPEHIGSLENEIEQWLIPGGFRPDAGDRVYMTGRWVVDCGHEDWHAEIHPYELVVSSHTQTGNPHAIGNIEVVASVVVTSDWQGHELDFDLWPPPRPSATARLRSSRDSFAPSPEHWNGGGIAMGVNVIETGAPGPPTGQNPNHLHLQIILGPGQFPDPLETGGYGEVKPNVTRRFAATYHLWWE